jgi:assimilatory nitrate reductase catalytic subunit
MAEAVRTTCPYCGVGCGLLARPDGAGWLIEGDPDHPANRGRLCSKGAALGETLGLETRLLHPVVNGHQVGWNEAIAETARRISETIERNSPDAFAFYLSGQLLTEDYYAANKLAKGFLGTANVDTNSRLCMASTVAGHRRAFGSDTVPGCYEDLELADLVVLVGSNLAWCHPVLFQRLRKAREKNGTRVVVIDPRRTDTCDIADLHLAIAPGSDVALFNGLLAFLDGRGVLKRDFIAARTDAFAEALTAAWSDAESAAIRCGVPTDEVARFYRWFSDTEKAVTVFSQGVNQSSAGTDKVNAIINVHLATGRIGRSGMGPFSVTGQPNAMGGREVGALANQLAAHMGFDAASIDRVRRFWNAPRVAQREGLKAVDLFRAMDEGRIKAVWIMATNPAVSLPESDLVRRALAKCPTVITSECVTDTDTLRFAHIRLPALAWGEKDGTVTNSERTISRQRAFLQPPGETRPDWWAVAEVAKALGFGDAFPWQQPSEIFREHAALSAFENDGSRDFDIGSCANLSDVGYDVLQSSRWPRRVGAKGETPRLFGDGRFFTPNGRARFVAVRHRAPREVADRLFPLRLNTGRYRDQWHTLSRTGLSPRLWGHRPEPFLDIHPSDAASRELADGDLVRVASRLGNFLARTRITMEQRPGEVFLPMHWNDRFAARAVSGRLIPGHVDPFSGQPELKHVAVEVTALNPSWFGLLVGRSIPDLDDAFYWVRHRMPGAEVVELAGTDGHQVSGIVADLDAAHGTSRIEFRDPNRGIARYAWMADDRLAAVLFVAPARPDISRNWISALMERELMAPAERAAILAGRAPQAAADDSRIVCSCFGVGLAAIVEGIRTQRLMTIEALGRALKAGTGCGSCLPELNALLQKTACAA